jgi:hypothetical protein
MKLLGATDLLEVWERGQARHPVDRALVVLTFACPERGWCELCELPIGERNRLLLAFRARAFGARLELVTSCPMCAERLEFEFTFPLATLPVVCAQEVGIELEEGRQIRVKLPDSLDLAAAASEGDPARARQVLLERCVLAGADGIALDTLERAVASAVERSDPLSVIHFPLRCAGCEAAVRVPFDPIDLVWRELGRGVEQLVRQIHTLARGYGWSEAEILGLSSARRQLYIEQLGGLSVAR